MKKVFFLYLIIILFPCNSFPEENKNAESKRLSFINTAYRYLKTPYKYAGTDEQGMDCSGLIYRSALKSANISLPRSAAGIASFVERIKDADIQPGDLLFFNTVGKKYPTSACTSETRSSFIQPRREHLQALSSLR